MKWSRTLPPCVWAPPTRRPSCRRFTRNNVQHPTYKAFAELGKAVKTIFLCRYLHSEALCREINEGLNVIEQWNSANDFVFFARRGEFASNRREDEEISMLRLQSAAELHGLYQHADAAENPGAAALERQADGQGSAPDARSSGSTSIPDGRFDLDMTARLPLL